MTTTSFQLRKNIVASELQITGSSTVAALGAPTAAIGTTAGNINPALGSFVGLGVVAMATAAATTMTSGAINIGTYTAANAETSTLPAATVGAVTVYFQGVAPENGGGEALIFDCAGTDQLETGSTVESRAGGVVSYVASAATNTAMQFIATATNNFFSQGSLIVFQCVNPGLWTVSTFPKAAVGGAGTDGAFTFAA